MLKVGARVRFKQDDDDLRRRERLIGEDGKDLGPKYPQEIALVPGPEETFTVRKVIPWERKTGRTDARGNDIFEDVLDGDAWADLGAGHSMVAMKLLEAVS